MILQLQDIEALLALAGKATPGPRCSSEMLHYGQLGTDFWYVGPLMSESEACLTENDAEFIAACSPEVVAALCRMARESEEARRQAFNEAIAIVTRYNIPTHSVVWRQMGAVIVALELARDRAPAEAPR